jgi:glycosyltransferase involved in cell wall biosynthesis
MNKTGPIVMLCDWLPPDFGAVGQYTLARARELAEHSGSVLLSGFTSGPKSEVVETINGNTLRVRKLPRPLYSRGKFFRRALWTLSANLSLLWSVRRELLGARELRFTGSPPYILHFVMPLAWLFRVKTVYRITDFHPECYIAMRGRTGILLAILQRMTNFWRRRVDQIEVLGNDQMRRLVQAQVPADHIVLRRDPSPVRFGEPELNGRKVILYSGNWGLAHDYETFLDGFAEFNCRWPDVAGVWLNATGVYADLVETRLRESGASYVRTKPVPLSALAATLRAADLHLITLKDAFVGYVLPSKVYACVESKRPVMFIGSSASDVDSVCREALPAAQYFHVGVGDVDGVAAALETALLGSGRSRVALAVNS